MSNQNSQLVLKVSSALSDKPTFLKLTNDQISVDRAIGAAIQSLNDKGETLKAKQLDDLYAQHQVFQNGKVVSKGSLLSELPKEQASIKGMEIQVINLDLIASHSGGL